MRPSEVVVVLDAGRLPGGGVEPAVMSTRPSKLASTSRHRAALHHGADVGLPVVVGVLPDDVPAAADAPLVRHRLPTGSRGRSGLLERRPEAAESVELHDSRAEHHLGAHTISSSKPRPSIAKSPPRARAVP